MCECAPRAVAATAIVLPMANEPGTARTLSAPARWLLLALAGVCILLGVVGIILPVMGGPSG